MSKVWDVIKKAPGAIRDVEADLPRSDKGIRDFPGKGLLTALVDTSGSELQRQRGIEDSVKTAMVKPLIEKYWMGNLADDEREAVATQIKSILGGGKQTKAFLDKMFEVGGQIHGVNKILMPPPGAADEAANQAVQVANQDQGTGAPGQPSDVLMKPPTSGSPAPTIQPPLAQPPMPSAPPLLPPPTSGSPAPMLEPPLPSPGAPPAPPSPMSTALTKMFPPGLSEQDKLQMEHDFKTAEQTQQNDARMAELNRGIEAGRYDRNTRMVNRVEMIDGVAKNVTRTFDPAGKLLTTQVHGDAVPRGSAQPRQAFIRGPEGKPLGVLLDVATNQIIPGSENPDLIPPASLLPLLTSRDALFVDDEGKTVTRPLQTIRSRDFGGATSTAPTTPTGQTLPGVTPDQSNAPPDEGLINFVMSRNKNQSRESTIEALQNTPPQILAQLRQQAAQSGILLAPPSAGPPSPPTGTVAPPTALPGSPGGAGGGTGAVSSPQAPMPGATSQGPVSTTPQQLPGRTLEGVNTVGQYNQSVTREIPLREAFAQIGGTPELPDAPSMMTYAHIADDKVRSEKLAKALTLTFNGLRQEEKAHGSLMNLLKLRVGIPVEEIEAQVATYRALIGDALADDPELQDAYNQTMAVFATAVGLRSLTRASASQASVEKIENEIPLFGLNSFSSRDVYSKLSRLMNEVYNGAKNTPTMRDDLAFIKSKAEELNRLARGTAISPPPGSRQRQRQGPELPGRIRVRIGNDVGTIDESEFDPATMERVGAGQ